MAYLRVGFWWMALGMSLIPLILSIAFKPALALRVLEAGAYSAYATEILLIALALALLCFSDAIEIFLSPRVNEHKRKVAAAVSLLVLNFFALIIATAWYAVLLYTKQTDSADVLPCAALTVFIACLGFVVRCIYASVTAHPLAKVDQDEEVDEDNATAYP